MERYFPIFILVQTLVSQPSQCPHGWIQRNSSCYAFITGAPDGSTEAEIYCNFLHSRLVEIETVAENEFIRIHLMDNHLKGNFWIGLSDVLVEGEWVWLSTQSPATYTDWAPHEPNNANSNEKCGTIDYNYHWNDLRCSEKSNFICEKMVNEEVDIIG
ncbi:perlucin-like [Saccostrea cucullata]|uniref:perlucin-like n=1 Tax=Saccostrea cuccullata TaxID=36930 RepID=UPI002ED11A96